MDAGCVNGFVGKKMVFKICFIIQLPLLKLGERCLPFIRQRQPTMEKPKSVVKTCSSCDDSAHSADEAHT